MADVAWDLLSRRPRYPDFTGGLPSSPQDRHNPRSGLQGQIITGLRASWPVAPYPDIEHRILSPDSRTSLSNVPGGSFRQLHRLLVKSNVVVPSSVLLGSSNDLLSSVAGQKWLRRPSLRSLSRTGAHVLCRRPMGPLFSGPLPPNPLGSERRMGLQVPSISQYLDSG